MKYSDKIADKIAEDLAEGNLKIEDVCKKNGITKPTFYEWKKSKPYFSNRIKEAYELRLESLGDMADSGLAKLLNGHEYEEVTTVYESGMDKDGNIIPVIKEKKVVKKFHMPNATAVLFTKTNRDSENWKHMQYVDHTSKGSKITQDFSGVSTKELLKRAKAIKKLEKLDV